VPFKQVRQVDEGLSIHEQLMMKEENAVACLVGAGMPTVFIVERKFSLHLKTLISLKHLEQSVLKLKRFTIKSQLRKNIGMEETIAQIGKVIIIIIIITIIIMIIIIIMVMPRTIQKYLVDEVTPFRFPKA
jgi:hypothetical protein